jgi:hypothetical protein
VSLVDKVKEQAGQVAAKAKEAGKVGQEKLEGLQAKRRADGLLRELGVAVYAEKTGRASGATAGEIERLTSELRGLEDAGVPVVD